MALNRLIDAKIDAANPRTAQRSLPAGRMSLLEAWGLAIAAALVLVLATLPLPPLCVMLLPVAFFILTVYSFVKRFSSLCHLVLGLALGTSAIGGWLAVTGVWSWHAVLLGLAVMFWVAGFDVLYALQDVAFDRSHGLFSLPASWGEGQAILLSRVFHGLTILCLLILGLTYPYTGWGLWLATLLMGLLLAYEHRLVSPGNLTQINEAFFKVNGRISVLFFVCILLDKFL